MADEETTADPQTLIDQLTRQVTELSGKLTAAETARDGFQARLRTTTHKQLFTGKLVEARVDPKAVDALWRLADYEPEADEPDPAAIDALVAAARESSPYAFLKDEVPEPADKKPVRLKKPLDEGRGNPPPSTPGKFAVTRANLADGRWMLANQDKVQAAQADGTFELGG